MRILIIPKQESCIANIEYGRCSIEATEVQYMNFRGDL